MNSNDSSPPSGRWSQRPAPRPFPHSPDWTPGTPKPYVKEDTLAAGQVQIERKSFVFGLKENARGRLLRITEDTGAKRNTIIIPASGLVEFRNVLDEMIKAAADQPAQKPGSK